MFFAEALTIWAVLLGIVSFAWGLLAVIQGKVRWRQRTTFTGSMARAIGIMAMTISSVLMVYTIKVYATYGESDCAR